jgi:hypothetical protein
MQDVEGKQVEEGGPGREGGEEGNRAGVLPAH